MLNFRNEQPCLKAGIMKSEQNGLPGYRGFEYQIDASIWIALDLMLDKARIDMMQVEPANAEDVEAALASPIPAPDPIAASDLQTASVNATVVKGRRMLYQMKTRSTGPWTAASFSDVVGNGLPPSKPARGPMPRARALNLLLDNDDTGYMLITDAGLDTNVFRLHSETLHADGSTVVPSSDLLDTGVQHRATELKGRVHILSGLTSELLQFRIVKLLTETGKVPHVRVKECIQELKAAFRARLLGTAPAWFERDELSRILRAHEGLSDKQHDPCYVAPADLADIEVRLDRDGLIILVGPPGAGKTMLAKYLATRHRQASPPFRVAWEHLSLGSINHHISTSGPTLLIIGDLWGTSTYVGESTFAHDLFGLIESTSRDKRFVITARSDVHARVPASVKERIAAQVIQLSDKNYGDDKLWTIFSQAAGLASEQLEILASSRDKILSRIRLPVALRKFADLVRSAACELALLPAPRRVDPSVHNMALVDQWLSAAEDATYGIRIRNLLEQWPDDLGEHVVLMWLLSEAAESIDIGQLRELAAAIRRDTEVKLRPAEFVGFLEKNGLALVSGDEVRIHSLVLEKMAIIVREQPSLADEFATAFLSIILQRARDEHILGRMERIAGVIRTLYSEPEAQADGWEKLVAEFDRMVEEACKADDPDVFRQGIHTGMWLPWTRSGFVRFLRALAPGESDTTPPWYGYTPTPEFISKAKESGQLDIFLPRFVAEFVPFTHIWYADEPGEFAEFVQRFDVPLEEAARAGLQAMEWEIHTPVPESGWWWYPDHNAPALFDLLPASEQPTAARKLGWHPGDSPKLQRTFRRAQS